MLRAIASDCLCLSLLLWCHGALAQHTIALIAPRADPLAAGVVCGMIEAGESWAEAGGRLTIHCFTGVRGAETIESGIERAVHAGAGAVIIWGRGWDSNAHLPDPTVLLQDLGLHWRIVCPSEASDHCDYRFAAADLAEAYQDQRWRLDDPLAPRLLAEGSIDKIVSPPLEEWGREALLALLNELDPTRARLIPQVEPPPRLVFDKDAAAQLEARWRKRMSQSQTTYSFPRESSVSASE